ncbi:hypothetical protein HMPREF3190_01310 [Umbribacter vaginalis]|nr:hypothetical protein HMPREF3190_01310 [Coriobacteriales bacterium DNF00809]
MYGLCADACKQRISFTISKGAERFSSASFIFLQGKCDRKGACYACH